MFSINLMCNRLPPNSGNICFFLDLFYPIPPFTTEINFPKKTSSRLLHNTKISLNNSFLQKSRVTKVNLLLCFTLTTNSIQ